MLTRPIAPQEMQDLLGNAGKRRPRLALMGEFSAGKSTLTNLLIGTEALPVKVTATQLPPVWLAKGDAPPERVALDGSTHPVDLSDHKSIPLADTLHIRVYRDAAFLENCDLIDFPGISDPNMPQDVWQRALHLADGVLWCTHANQAWRQSEAAVWEDIGSDLMQSSLLLLTRMDKVADPRDRSRLIARVLRETEGLFANIIPISLTQAIAAESDPEAWRTSGAEALHIALQEILSNLAVQLGQQPMAHITPSSGPPAPPQPVKEEDATDPLPPPATQRVMPRRVSLRRNSSGVGRPAS